MPIPWGRVSFPGLGPVLSAEYVNSQGTDPGVALVTTAPERSFPAAVGTLILYDGITRIVLPSSKVAKCTGVRDGGPLTWLVTFLDRRWKWAGGAISGKYNTRGRTGLIKLGTEKSPQELATLLFQALGETTFDVGALPDDARPEIDWDFAEPAQALTELCERLGCRVVYRISSNSAAIVRQGVGRQLPKVHVLKYHATVDPPERPDQIIFAGGAAQWQAQFYVEPVGLELNGLIKPIRELSYRPFNPQGAGQTGGPQDTGWENTTPPFFPEVKDPRANALARLTIFRWYRLKMVDPSTIKASAVPGNERTVTITDRLGKGQPSAPGDRTRQNLKGSFKLQTLDSILPVEEYRLTPGFGNDRAEDEYGASVQGWFLKPALDGVMTQDVTRYEGSFTIDRERGLVIFKDYLRMRGIIGGKDLLRPAMLFVTLTFSVRDADGQPGRYVKTYQFPGPSFGALPVYVRREEAVLQTAIIYPVDTQGNPQSGYGTIASNQSLLDTESNYYLQAEAAKYQTQTPEDITYAGLKALEPDGAILQVTHSLPPCTTRASRHTEHHLQLDSFRQRLMNAVGREVLDPEWLANIRRQLLELQQTPKPLGPGLRG